MPWKTIFAGWCARDAWTWPRHNRKSQRTGLPPTGSTSVRSGRWRLTPCSSKIVPGNSQRDQAALEGEPHQISDAPQLELLHDAAAMCVDRVDTDLQLRGDVLGRLPFS